MANRTAMVSMALFRRCIYPLIWFCIIAVPGATMAAILLLLYAGHWLRTGEWDEEILLRGDIEKREAWLRQHILT